MDVELAGHDAVAAFEDQYDIIGLAATGELEPAIRDAIDDGIRDLVRAANASLARAGDPLGLRTGSIEPDADSNAPTTERVVNRGDWDIATVGKDRKAEAWRHIPVVEAMIRRGQIGKDEAPEMLDAAKRFYRDFVLGHRVGGLVAQWGAPGGGGTPIGQQVPKHYTDRNGAVRECLGPDDRRTHHHTAWYRAAESIGFSRCPVTGNRTPGLMLQWMLKLVCEDYAVATETTPRLEDAGRAYLGLKCPKQASAAGGALIKAGIERLVQHYEAVDRRR